MERDRGAGPDIAGQMSRPFYPTRAIAPQWIVNAVVPELAW
jgi:hypothetical protein